jgi:hypothetical protein
MLLELFHVVVMLAAVGIPFIVTNIIIEKIKDHNAR